MTGRESKNSSLEVEGAFLGLPGLIITSADYSGKTALLCAEIKAEPMKCLNCGSGTMWRHGVAKNTIRSTPINGLPCVIILSRKRWRCPICGSIVQEHFPQCIEENGYTTHLTAYLNEKCLTRKLKDLEEEVGISDSTLQRYTVQRIEALDKKYRFPLSCKIGLDEVKIGGQFRTTITNLDKRTLINLLPARQGEYLVNYFKTAFTEEERKKVLWICTDMWRSFAKHLKPLFPNARWVIDKWHVQKEANMALDGIRRQIQNDLPTKTAKKKLKKQLRWSLLHRQDDPDLSVEELELLNADLAVVQYLLPDLWIAYGLKEEFFKIYDDHGTREEAEKAFAAWEKSIPEKELFAGFRTLAATVNKNRNAVFNYWRSGNLTNAFTECENNLIRATDRSGRGYSFNVLRGRVLYNSKAIKAAELRGKTYGPNIETLREEMEPATPNK